jgi:CBS-domain-containing membrane protein
MTASPQVCNQDDDIRDVQQVMASRQLRRIPIVDGNGSCVGIIAQADLAMAASKHASVNEREVAIVVEAISKPPSSAQSADHRM